MSPPSLSRRSLLKAGAATGTLALAGLAGCSAKPPSSDLSWSMWSSSAAEDAVWADFSAYVEKTLGRRSIANLTPSSGYPTKMDLQLVSGTQSMVHAVNGFLVPTYAARGHCVRSMT
ncbi:twin-arginine translocation signal domain-containing protein [Propioniciclava coleopterorum]|uniref:twin-arginine translocation signal domain-containing protein n=1 Tax=Propioniciclava coleopterorum TaxID=2714937 RepID=UPI00197FC2F0|nr:twin-arginine translocation signal domain-containing protein [Propioniciclava coleopterorum]